MVGARVTTQDEFDENARLESSGKDALPDSIDQSGPCPRCSRYSQFSNASMKSQPLTFVEPDSKQNLLERVTVLLCHGCGQGVLVVEEAYVGGVAVRNGAGSGFVQWRGIFWWPSPGMQTSDPDVPARVGDVVAEGVRCLSANAPRAAAVMFRGALAEIVTDRGSDAAKTKRSLAQQLKQMAEDHSLDAGLADWADHIRLLGNAGAHPNEIESVTVEEAQELGRLIASMLEYLYRLPAQLRRRREGR